MRRLSSSVGVAAILVALVPVPSGIAVPRPVPSGIAVPRNGVLTEEVRVLEAAAPSYPALAAAANESGKVTVEVHVTEGGTVDRVGALDGHVLLRAEAEAAARRWRFQSVGDATLRLQFVFTLLSSKTQRQELLTIFRPPYEVEIRQSMPESIVTSDPKGYVRRRPGKTKKPPT